MAIETAIPLLDDILGDWQSRIGADYPGYRNHVYRVLQFCFYLRDATEEERRKLIIAAAFHDIGIWSANTVDYLEPSIEEARRYLERAGLSDWDEEIALIIGLHHRMRRYDGTFALVELFRRADLVDFSLGMIRWGVPKAFVDEVKAAFPNAGFHRRLVQLSWVQFKKHPLNPAPMLRW